MKNKWIVSILSAALMLVFFFALQSCNRTAAQCPLCERVIHQHMQVSITHNSLPMKTCCMSCALTYKAQVKNVEIKAATDFLSNESIDPQKAFYVVGSDVSPCTQDPKVQKFIREPHAVLHACYDRCEPGILAFKNNSEATSFVKTHGGQLQSFDQLPNWLPTKGMHHHD
jgi:hypothetical protein